MANLDNYPLEDNFETSLSQAWTGGTGTIYVNDTPSFSFPSGITTYIVVNPGKTNMQVATINAYDASAKTMTVSDVTLNKAASVAYSAQTHAVGSVVRISNNFQNREDINTVMSTKVDGDTQPFPTYANDAARDAAITSPLNGMVIYNTADLALNQYIGGAWATFASGTTSAASTTVAGKVEIATAAELTAGTATGGTGASLASTPDVIQASIQSGEALYAGASAAGTDTYAVTMTPTLTAYSTGMSVIFKADVANTGAATINIDSLGAKTIIGLDGNTLPNNTIIANQFAHVVYNGTAFALQNPADFETRITANATAITANTLKSRTIEASISVDDTNASITIAHGCGVAPISAEFTWMPFDPSHYYEGGTWSYDGSTETQKTYYNGAVVDGVMARNNSGGSDYNKRTITSVDATNLNIDRTFSGTFSTTSRDVRITFFYQS